MFGLRIGDAAGEVRDFDDEVAALFEDAVNLSEDSVKIVEMFQDVFGVNPVDGIVLQGIRELVEVKDDIRPILDVDIDAERMVRFVGATAEIKDCHDSTSLEFV